MAKRKRGVIRAMKRISNQFSQELSFLAALPAALWQLLFMLAPVGIIFYFSVSDALNPWAFTLSHYAHMLQLSYFKIIFRSLFLGVLTGLSCLIFAYPVAYYLALRVKRFKNILLFLLTLPFWVNFLVQIYAWYFLLEYNGLLNMILLKLGIISEPILFMSSLFSVYLVMVYCYLPFMIMPLYSTLEKIDMRLLDASADLGATHFETFMRITLPLSIPGMKTGFLLVMIPAFGEFVIPALLGGSKNMLVGSLISYYFLAARNNNAGAAFTCLSGLILIAAMLAWFSFSKLMHLRSLGRSR